MSLILRLNLIVSILLLAIFIIVFFNILDTTAERVRQEVVSNFELSNQMVEAKIKLMHSVPVEMIRPYPYVDVSSKRTIHLFNIENFNGIKYITVDLFDSDNKRIASNRDGSHSSTLQIPEKIKKLLLMGFFTPMEHISSPIVSGDLNLGTIVVSTDSETELRDLWYETLSTVTPIMVMFMLISLAMTFIISYLVKPVADFLRAVSVERAGNDSQESTLYRFSHLFHLPRHLQGIHHELKDSSQKVHELNNKILDLQEEERRRISAELHDELGQHLTAIRFEAELIRTANSIEDTRQSAEAIDDIGRTMKDIVRSMLERLRPPDLDILGLEGAITEMMSNWQLRHPQTDITFEYEADFTAMNDSKQLSIYRIIQEGLTNISRHAGALMDSVTISLTSSEDQLTISIIDNGQGCDLSEEVNGFGLKGMRERVDVLSGQLTLISSQGNGMKIIVDISKPKIER